MYAIKQQGEPYHEFRRLLNLWSDPLYLIKFLVNNKIDLPKNKTIPEIADIISNNAKQINEILKRISTNKNEKLDTFFCTIKQLSI